MNNIETKYIYSSGLHVSRLPLIMNTVLGSCVSVCLWDQDLKAGGMNHFMLPFWNGSGLASPKYGNIAMEQLVKKMTGMGCRREDLVAKIFGGAKMLREQSEFFDIGRRNIDLARKLLDEHDISITASSIGGNRGRRIFFNSATGEVLQKFL